jgi:hypothetical protein
MAVANGLTYPLPRTWAAGDIITAARLRDFTNLAALFTSGRPLLVSYQGSVGQAFNPGTSLLQIYYTQLNTWNVPVITSISAPGTSYTTPLDGWYLCEASLNWAGTGTVTAKQVTGFQATLSSTVVQNDAGAITASPTAAQNVGIDGCDLFQCSVGDALAVYGYQNSGSTNVLVGSFLKFEWVALPTTFLSGPAGTVVPSPVGAAPFPPGPGTTLAGAVSAGATSIQVALSTGMTVGGTLGLDYYNAKPYQNVAEKVSITSVAGATIGISAARYPHVSGAPVAVPVSATFLNQQVRDLVSFLAYPPILRAETTQAQTLGTQTLPAGTQITNLTTSSLNRCVDNFSGFASNAYTIPVSGIYYVYGQVYLAGATVGFSCSAGIAVNAGTILWGVRFRSAATSAVGQCPTVRKVLRLTAGQTITLYGTQSSGANMVTLASGAVKSKLICVWRAV